MPTRTQISAVISEGAKCNEQNKPVMGVSSKRGSGLWRWLCTHGPTEK